MNPLVSVLIPCYNARPWIAECIQSAIDQTYAHKEIVVVDDGSTDGSLDVIRGFGDRIRFETGPNRGGNAARNRLVELSRGSWLSFLDADDYLLPEKIERQMAVIATDAEIDVVYSPLIEFIETISQTYQRSIEDDDLYTNYIRWHPFSSIAPVWRKSAILDVGGWNPSQLVCQEHELVLRLIMAGKRFELLREALSVYRKVEGSSVSRRSPLRTLKQKMALTEKFAAYLAQSGKLNEGRRRALAQAHFEAARSAYAWDLLFAKEMMAKAGTVALSEIEGVNRGYRLALTVFGFEFAERLAKMQRVARKKAVG